MDKEGHNKDKSFVGLDKIRVQHAQQVAKFQEWADCGRWSDFPRNHFDWWAFPIDLPSTNYGLAYSLGRADAAQLLADPSFLPLYRKGVELIALSWGWDIERQQPVTNPGKQQQWGRHDIRLRKVGQSLLLFGQSDLHASLDRFVAHLEKDEGFSFDTASTAIRGDWPFTAGRGAAA